MKYVKLLQVDYREWIDENGYLTLQKVYKILSPVEDVLENQTNLLEEGKGWELLKR